ncbi:hypothetical protein DFH05DRAFT_474744 [Lentinula detonsa]|uniref:Uncharacterized protein n=1 Tax=Lentinula detonsa TaxID=2804962 RepID=A0A9W8NSN0_9AGAR|nr:hypothetical protein DFH05DRAFT_474744 [Lentinula detonsa]
MAVTSIRCFSETSLPTESRCGRHGKPSYDPGLKAALAPVLSPETAHCIYYYRRPDVNASSMLIQNIFPESPQSCSRHYYEPSNDKMLLHSGLFRHRHILENRALATWISLCIQHKLVLYDPGICFDERELLDALTYKLTKALQFLNSPTPAIFIALLYLNRIFPDHIPYFGNPDEECSAALQRLFLLCLRLALQWFEDRSEFWDFRVRNFKWHELLGLERAVFRNADVHTLHLLGHNLCVSNITYARWLSHLLSTLPALLPDRLNERREISRLIHAIRPSLTPEFLHPNCLPCSGLPFDKNWKPAHSCAEAFTERGRNLMDCITYRLSVPLYAGPTVTDCLVDAKGSPRTTYNNPVELNDSSTSTESSTASIDTHITSPDLNPTSMQLKPSPSKRGSFSNQRNSPARPDGCTVRFKRSQLPRSPFPSSTTGSISSLLYGASRLLIERLLGD